MIYEIRAHELIQTLRIQSGIYSLEDYIKAWSKNYKDNFLELMYYYSLNIRNRDNIRLVNTFGDICKLNCPYYSEDNCLQFKASKIDAQKFDNFFASELGLKIGKSYNVLYLKIKLKFKNKDWMEVYDKYDRLFKKNT